MKRSKIKISYIILTFFIIGISIFFITKKELKNSEENLINISNLSENFINNYLEKVSEIEDEDKDNMLIITSKDKIENTYGATSIIEGPNNKYFLQYESEETKNNAFEKFNNSENSSIEVSENVVYEISENSVLVTNFNSWGVEAMSIDTLLEELKEHELQNVTVAIVDTGLNVELFNQNYPNRLAGVYNVLTCNEEMTDEVGHGTHIAGTIAESTPNSVKILPIKITKTKSMYDSDIIAAIDYVTYNKKADVMNMSFGGNHYSKANYLSIEAAKQSNIISVAAAGNENTSQFSYPASFENTISIAAVDSYNQKADFSNYGNSIMFAAPGVNISSINGIMSGTSMATPHAVGAVAILKSLNKTLTMDETVTILRRYSIDIGNMGWDIYYGYGFINFEDAQICNDKDCDEFNVFKKSNKDNLENIVESFQIIPEITDYNYGTINNILNTVVSIKYTNGKTVGYKLYEIPNLKVEGYDPNLISDEWQNVSISFVTPIGQKIEGTFKIRHTKTQESVWDYNIIDNNSIELTNFKDTSFRAHSLYIPSEIGEYKVVATADLSESLFESAINSFWGIYNLYLPNTLTKVGKNSFYMNLGSIEGNNLTYVKSEAEELKIMDNAFKQSSALTTFDANISYIGNFAFEGASSLIGVNLGKLTYIGNNAFDSALKNAVITIPESVVSFGNNVFDNAGIREISLLNNLTKIPDNMFSNNTSLEKVTLSDSVLEIGNNAFSGCEKLKEIKLSQNLKNIGNYSFSGCEKLEYFELPESLISIGEGAFKNTLLKESLTIPKNVTSIGSKTFMNEHGDSQLKEIIFLNSLERIPDSMLFNNIYIERVVLPNNVKEIGSYAFYHLMDVKTLELPETLTSIGTGAFQSCLKLTDLYFGRNVNNIANTAFQGISKDARFHVYNNTTPETFALNNNINYTQIDPDNVNVNGTKNEYKALEKVDLSSLSVELTYSEKVTRKETINENIEILYESYEDKFKYGDSKFTISLTNNSGFKISSDVKVSIVKLTPAYEIPTNLKANEGQKLSEISLPNGFEWMNKDEVIEGSGNLKFKAKFIPDDTINYKIEENIEINITVKANKEIIIPNIVIKDKIYDGTTQIPIENITISNLIETEYTITCGNLSSSDVGDRNITIKLKLTDEKFKNYTFDNGKQEKEFILKVKITPKKLSKPYLKTTNYVYNGSEQTVNLVNFDQNIMNISGNKRLNAGEQDVVISLKNNNYIWDDNTSSNVILKFRINKANPNIEYSSSGKNIKYNGLSHGIDLIVTKPNNAIIKYMDNKGNYSLNEMPKYIDPGEYTIKFRIYINDNYTDIKDEETLIITKSSIENNTKDYETIYDGKEHSINIDVNINNYTIKYSTDNKDYNLTTLPKFKDIGEYIIYYKITAKGYDDLTGSNKVKIYGLKGFDKSIKQKSNMLILTDNSFKKLKNNTNIFSKTNSINHLDSKKKSITSDSIKTGDYISIKINNDKTHEYKLVYIGDVNGNGLIDVIDYIRIMKHIMNSSKLTGEFYEAADVNANKQIDVIDYIRIMKIIMEENK